MFNRITNVSDTPVYLGLAMALVSLSCVTSVVFCLCAQRCAAVGLRRSARGAQGAPGADASGRRRGDLAHDRGHTGRRNAGDASFGPRRAARALVAHVAGAYERSGELAWILVLASVIMAMGLIDDLKNLNWRLRLGIQFACATGLAVSGIRVTLFGPFAHPLLGGAVTVFWIVGLTNAFNMLDNMDGLAASVGLIAASLFCGAQAAAGSLFAPAVLLVVVGALAGFLVHNHAPARLFMGDAGSNFLGFLLGTLTVVGTFTRQRGGLFAVRRACAATGHGGAALRHGLGDLDSVSEGRSPFWAIDATSRTAWWPAG